MIANMRLERLLVRGALLVAFLVGDAARAQVADPCHDEARRLCAGVAAGQGRIVNCLIANLARIQDAACRAHTQAIHDRQEAVSRECRAEIDGLCRGKGFGTGLLVCLDGHQSQLSESCRAARAIGPDASSPVDPKQAALAITAQDRIVTAADGERYVVTAHNGVAHPLMHLASGEGNPVLHVAPGAPAPCKNRKVTNAPTAKRVMLDDQGYVPPAKDQTGRATCNVFSVIALLETEYLIQYFKMTNQQYLDSHKQQQFSLSEQYLQSLKVETHTALHDLGSSVTNLLRLAPFCGATPMYGLPQESIWPYIDKDIEVMNQMRPSVPKSPSDYAAFYHLVDFEQWPASTTVVTGANGLPSALNVDLSNYAWSNLAYPDASGSLANYAAVYPPPAVHESAQWGPVDVIQLDVPLPKNLAVCGNQPMSHYSVVSSTDSMVTPMPADCVAALAAPFEKILAEKHPIVYFTDWDLYHVDFKMRAFVYSNPKDKALDWNHCMILIGYDRDKQIFRFKNSWGPDWNKDGTGEMTYDLFFRMMSGAYPTYVDKVWDPTQGALPNGVWRGFWQGQLHGVSGVAIIHHLGGVDSQDLAISDGGLPAGSFYGQDGSQTDFLYLDWSEIGGTYSVRFADTNGKPLFSLTRSIGTPTLSATFADLANAKAGPANWSKCAQRPGVATLSPSSYLDTFNDPYVIPPCETVPAWHVAPTWSCPRGEIPDGSLPYVKGMNAKGDPISDQQAACVQLSATAPVCPAGTTLLADVQLVGTGIPNGGVVSPTGQQMPWQDICSPPQTNGAPPTTHKGTLGKFDQLGCVPGFCAVPTCPAPSSVFADAAAVLGGRATGGVWAQKGADGCIRSVHGPHASCGTGFLLTNGVDCVRPPKPGPPSPLPRGDGTPR